MVMFPTATHTIFTLSLCITRLRSCGQIMINLVDNLMCSNNKRLGVVSVSDKEHYVNS